MDASASPQQGADNNKVYGFILKIDGGNYSTPSHIKNTVIKYTKLPDLDNDTKVSWSIKQSYTLPPRLRRIITLDDDDCRTSRSLRSISVAPPKVMAAHHTKRKVVTISEDDEHGVYQRFSKAKKPSSVKMSNRSIETDFKQDKPLSTRTTTRLANSAKYTKEIKTSAKVSTYNKKEVNANQQNYRGKVLPNFSTDNTRPRHIKEKDLPRNSRSANQSKSSVSKNFVTPSESVKELTRIKNILYDNLKTNVTYKKAMEKPKLSRSPPPSINKNKINLKETSTSKSKQMTIRVPLDDKFTKPKITGVKSKSTLNCDASKLKTTDRGDNTDTIIQYTHINIGTEPIKSVDQMTEMHDIERDPLYKFQTSSIQEIFDSLEIPNVTLTKEKPEIKKEIVNYHSTTLPIPIASPIETSRREELSSSDISFCRSAYVFSRASVTYTSRQKINLHIVDNDEKVSYNMIPSPLNYPVNVVSVLKNDFKNKDKQEKTLKRDRCIEEKNVNNEYLNSFTGVNSLNCSYVFNKLIKPSDIISTLRLNNGLLQSDYICEQFQRELNFIDSFFESLQYLEGCSLSDKCLSENKVDSLVNKSLLFDSTFDVKNSEYDNFLSNLENGANVDDTETMASKSLCLLNLLIRDEQRRAKNLLFVLKMREDALKDFTKSQILWLEKKKKQDNTDISTLKKKQRGALLKLQHECGEMQRMRKALLTLSEKRKVALMKTKKNIELKLKNNVNVDDILMSKKRLKRISPADRNTSPLKCFDLSSSGCEDSTPSRPTSDSAGAMQEVAALVSVTSAEKCVQTGDIPCAYPEHQGYKTTDENFVAVDGGYLNILFRDLMFPQIFSNGKQYEVNEDALKNIVFSTNNQNNLGSSKIVEKLMEQIKNRDMDTSSPSTARSLVEEFDQYYRGLTADDNLTPSSTSQQDLEYNSKKVFEVKDASVQSDFSFELARNDPTENKAVIPCSAQSILINNDAMLSDGDKSCVREPMTLKSVSSIDKEPVLCGTQTQTGPLPVPVGAAAGDVSLIDIATWVPPKSSSSSSSDTDSEVSQYTENQNFASLTSLSTPVQCEAEELRRQQLEIEREIKALEQQQCRLLVVREIPDKPPPPYTPPMEVKSKPPRLFALDETSTPKIEKYILQSPSVIQEGIEDAFDEFLKDYCEESLERHKHEQSVKPWDACNLLPKKPQITSQKIIHNTSTEVKEVLASVPPTNVSGISSRRSDHIDDILFTEWRRCEPEWTALHTDEVIVKNQIFESIFQKILTDTIDEYKKTVTTNEITTD